MSNLQLIKSDRFGQTECDIYSDKKEMFMTMAQLSDCLGYADRKGVEKMVERNSYLKQSEFSVTDKMSATDRKAFQTRLFTEDGIYEVTMLAKTEKAKEFRAWVRKLLKSLRTGEVTAIKTDKLMEIDIRAKANRAIAMRMNAENRRLKLLLLNPEWKGLSPVAFETMGIKAAEQATGANLGQFLPKVESTYSATEIGKAFGIPAQTIGKKATALGLKTEKHGFVLMDKSPYSTKEVKAFRYHPISRNTIILMINLRNCRINLVFLS